jgi:hypothetical protein
MVYCHSEHIKSRYGKYATLMYSDTSSLIYHSITDDIHEDMIKDNDMIHFSDYPTDHKLYKMNIVGKSEHGKHIINTWHNFIYSKIKYTVAPQH